MTLIRTVLLISSLVLMVYGGAAVAQSGAPEGSSSAAASKPLLTLQMPAFQTRSELSSNPRQRPCWYPT